MQLFNTPIHKILPLGGLYVSKRRRQKKVKSQIRSRKKTQREEHTPFFLKGGKLLISIAILEKYLWPQPEQVSSHIPSLQLSSFCACVMKYHDASAFCWGPVCTFQTINYGSPSPSYLTVLLFSLVSVTEVTNGQLKSYYLLLAYRR